MTDENRCTECDLLRERIDVLKATLAGLTGVNQRLRQQLTDRVASEVVIDVTSDQVVERLQQLVQHFKAIEASDGRTQ